MLLGRSDERHRLDELLGAARGGRSVAVVIRGEAGIGKSALVDELVDGVVRQGGNERVLRARGMEAESEISFAGLSDLLRPVQDLLQLLPQPQAAALAGALALGPPAAHDRFAVAAATLSILAAAARDAPLICAIDDAHWLDAASTEALVFAARRMRAEGSLIVFAVRDGERGSGRFDALEEIRLAGLSVPEATKLLNGKASALPQHVVEQLVADTGGNPLALKELPRQLSPEQISGEQPILEPLPLGSLLVQAFTRRIAGLPAATRAALIIASASDLEAADVTAEALRSGGGGLADLEPAEAAGLINLTGGSLSFEHPLVRSAVYHAASPGQRRAAHALLAGALQAVPAPQADERRAWHLAAATVTADKTVAAQLERVGLTACERRSYLAGAQALERSARLSPDPVERTRRLQTAAAAAALAGLPAESLRLLEEAQRFAGDEATATLIEGEVHRFRLWSGPPQEGLARLLAFAARVEDRMPSVAAYAYLAAAQASLTGYDSESIARSALNAIRLAGSDEFLAVRADVLRAFAAAQVLDFAAAEEILTRRAAQLGQADPLSLDQLGTMGAVAFVTLERMAEARRLMAATVAGSRAANAAGVLTMQLPWLATLEFLDGHWSVALVLADEAVQLVRQTGWLGQLPNSLSTLAKIEAGLGLPAAVQHAQEALEAGSPGAAVHARIALGMVELGAGRPAEAAAHLQAALGYALERNAPLLQLQILPELIEAEVGANLLDEAHRDLDRLDAVAGRSGRASDRAAAARCHGLLDREDFEPAFASALALHARGGAPFERARTLFAQGVRLRRARDRAGARQALEQALEIFERLGASAWAGRIRAELLAAGGRPVPSQDGVAHLLTPQELQVALAVREGRSNAETATALFLSVKTIEYHLSNTYRKLGVRSRTQLARVLDDLAPAAGG